MIASNDVGTNIFGNRETDFFWFFSETSTKYQPSFRSSTWRFLSQRSVRIYSTICVFIFANKWTTQGVQSTCRAYSVPISEISWSPLAGILSFFSGCFSSGAFQLTPSPGLNHGSLAHMWNQRRKSLTRTGNVGKLPSSSSPCMTWLDNTKLFPLKEKVVFEEFRSLDLFEEMEKYGK